MRRFLRWLRSWFKRFGDILVPLLKDALDYATCVVMENIEGIVEEAVKAVAKDPSLITDEDKRRVMLNLVKSKLEDAGKSARDSVIMRLAELVIGALKKRGEI